MQKQIDLLYPVHNSEFYELIDCGGFEKLERFGEFITIRPEPQAVWDKVLSEAEWKKKAHVKFVGTSSNSGRWEKYRAMPDNWQATYRNGDLRLTFNLALTGFKHVGVFPEQSANWDFIYSRLNEMKGETPAFLNLFAYTGGASLAAKAAGADVTHVDSIKQVVSWSRRNMESSNLDNIRWVVEDAVKFVKREKKRGKQYQGIILDPPAFGHGPNGESWKLEKQINELLKDVLDILDPKQGFMILNTYSLGFSALIVENMILAMTAARKNNWKPQFGELYMPATSGIRLPLGVYCRM
ncbi:MAG: class I SAM-dependent methyltransferase [Flavobacteriales bacterium]